MASKARPAKVEKSFDDSPSAFKLGEIGYVGLKISSGIAQEELRSNLNFPASMTTYKQMSYHAVIAAALALYEIMLTKVEWNVQPPENATQEEIERSKFIAECMHDMDHSWLEFMQEVVSMKTYGFSVHEKVFRRRLKSKGSKYNDGKIGWKKLAPRSQDTIEKFLFDDEGRDFIGVKQNLGAVKDYYNRFSNLATQEVKLPRSKILLFRTGKNRDNPFGRSTLRDCYFSWKFLTQIEEIEATGVARDLQGLPMVSIPSLYMTEDATPAQKAFYETAKNIARNVQANQQGGIVKPSDVDPESKTPLFTVELLGTEGKKNFNTEAIKNYHKNNIMTAMFTDILIMGQGSTGSYALGNLKNNLLGVAVEALLREIKEVINSDLIRQTYELNGWDVSRLPTLIYDDFQEENLEEFSKAIQRFSSTGMLELDRPILNKVRDSIGVEPRPDDAPVDKESLTGSTSKSGEGFKTPFEGTRTSDGSGNDNDGNLDNSA